MCKVFCFSFQVASKKKKKSKPKNKQTSEGKSTPPPDSLKETPVDVKIPDKADQQPVLTNGKFMNTNFI